MTNVPARRLKTYRSPGPMPGLRRYGSRKSGLACSTHTPQAQTFHRSPSAQGSHRSADYVATDCLAFVGNPRRARRVTQPGSARMPCSAASLSRHSLIDGSTRDPAHECCLPGRVTQPGSHRSRGIEPPLRLMNVPPVSNCFWSLHRLRFTAVTQVGSPHVPGSFWTGPRMAILLAPARTFGLTQPGSGWIEATSAQNSRSPHLAQPRRCAMT